MKRCSRCGKDKSPDEFQNKRGTRDGLDYWCRQCKAADKIKYLSSKGLVVNEVRFKSLVGGLSSIAAKVFNVLPPDAYWSASRVQSELFRTAGVKADPKITSGVLDSLVKHGLVIEVQKGMFSKVTPSKSNPKPKDAATAIEYHSKTAPKQQEAIEMAEQPPLSQSPEANPIDTLREITIKFMDVTKTINNLAVEIDNQLVKVEQHLAAKDHETAKFNQLKSLLSSL